MATIDFAKLRRTMVECQLRPNKVIDTKLLAAFEDVPRELFVPKSLRGVAYVDEDLQIAPGRYLMEPMVLARLIQAADLEPDEVVLDIGAATGYGAAILSGLASTVVAVESDLILYEQANAILRDLGKVNCVVVSEPLTAGYPRSAPYDVILVEGAVAEIPTALTDQLADGGRLLAVVAAGTAAAAFSGLRGSAVGQAVICRRIGGTVSRRVLFDAQVPVLPGFEARPRFVF